MLWRESLITTGKKKVLVVCLAGCAVVFVSVFGSGGKYAVFLLWQESFITTGKNTRFAWAGGTCPRFAWAGRIFSPVILLCQFLVLAGNRFWFYILLFMYFGYRIVPYSCSVVLVFLVFAGNSFWCYVRT